MLDESQQTDEKVKNVTPTTLGGGIAVQGTPSATEDEFRVATFGELDVVYTVARLISGSTTWAKNALSTVMLSAYRRWPSRPPEIRPRVWMLTMLVDYLERVGAASIAAGFAEPETEAEPTDTEEGLSLVALRHAIQGMALQDRVVLTLSDVASLSHDDVGKVLEVRREHVRRRLLGARARLQRSLNVDSASLSAVGGKD